MKALVCEMCASPNLIKKDGMYVCENCGTRYTVEEARKMMIDGTVDVQGTVKVDNSAFVQKYLANARRAKEKEDWEETEKYYNMVEQNDPDNIEAIFYSSYGKAKTSLTDNDVYKRAAVFKVLKNCISVVDDHYKPERREENKQAIISMGVDLGKMVCSSFVFTEWKNGYGVVTRTNKIETIRMFTGLLNAFKETMDNIQKIDDQPYLHEAAIAFYTIAMATGYWEKDFLQGWIDEEKRELEALKAKAISAYWSEHTEEKAALDQEREALSAKVKNLNAEISSLPEVKAEAQIEAKIGALQQEKSALGLFKGKEKKALQEQISLAYGDLEKVKPSREAAVSPIQAQIDAANARIAEIDKELTKER